MSPKCNYKVQLCLQGTTTKFNYVSKVQLQSSTMSPRYNYKVQLCLQGTTTKFNYVSKVQLQSSTMSPTYNYKVPLCLLGITTSRYQGRTGGFALGGELFERDTLLPMFPTLYTFIIKLSCEGQTSKLWHRFLSHTPLAKARGGSWVLSLTDLCPPPWTLQIN